MTASIIVAMATNRVIGIDNDLPWHLSADLKYFKKVTMGKPIIMGRKTFDSIGRPLPGRQNVVITRNPDWVQDGVDVVNSVEAAIELTTDQDEVMIIGGAQIYAAALPLADRLYLTEVDLSIDGDAYFPEIDAAEWREVSREPHGAEGDDPAFAFVVLNRV